MKTRGTTARMRSTVARWSNRMLRPLGARLVPLAKPWDEHFQRWIATATHNGMDPNDIGDAEWADDPLPHALERHYLPHIRPESRVLELGPGTGRLTRHLIRGCREMVLIDYSEFACEFLRDYLRQENVSIHRVSTPRLPMVPSASVDFAVANGVFEHFDPEETLWWLTEFHRVLKPGGTAALNFANLMTAAGMEWLKKWSAEPGSRCIFRFYHPEMMRALACAAGFTEARITTQESWVAYAELTKAAQAGV